MTKNWLIFILFITIALLSISGCSPNNPPVFCSIPDQSVNEGDTLELNLLNHATDPDGDTLSFTLITGVGTITENTYIYSPDYNASGTYTVEIEAIDGRGGSASDSFLITVNNANRNPTNPYDLMPTNEMINVSLDTTISWSCSDPDGDPLKYDIYFGISPTPADLMMIGHTASSKQAMAVISLQDIPILTT